MNPFSNTYNSDASDRELFKRIKEGDKNSLNTLISRHQPFIYNIAWKMTGDSVTAEDLSQEALLKIISNLGSFKHKSSFRTWAYLTQEAIFSGLSFIQVLILVSMSSGSVASFRTNK